RFGVGCDPGFARHARRVRSGRCCVRSEAACIGWSLAPARAMVAGPVTGAAGLPPRILAGAAGPRGRRVVPAVFADASPEDSVYRVARSVVAGGLVFRADHSAAVAGACWAGNGRDLLPGWSGDRG